MLPWRVKSRDWGWSQWYGLHEPPRNEESCLTGHCAKSNHVVTLGKQSCINAIFKWVGTKMNGIVASTVNQERSFGPSCPRDHSSNKHALSVYHPPGSARMPGRQQGWKQT